MAEERIQKIMAEQGLCSRRAAEQIIAEGRVKVNGHPVKVGDKMDPNRDVLHVDDERIYIRKDQQLYYLALYKPRGYVTTASDESLSIAPHSGVGACTPSPKNDSVEILMIAQPTSSEARTTRSEVMEGSRWRNSMNRSGIPTQREN